MMNIQKGNMYGFVTHTWNTIKGKCSHDCSYCYMKRFSLNKVRFDEKELHTDLGKNNFIFVGSSCDMWAKDIPDGWILSTISHCEFYPENTYLFQSKNPFKMGEFNFPNKTILCLTLESNRNYPEIYKNSPKIYDRVNDFIMLNHNNKMITIEPILDFDLDSILLYIKEIYPIQVNIGADSGNNKLPEPPKEKVIELIKAIPDNIRVFQKDNLRRLLK